MKLKISGGPGYFTINDVDYPSGKYKISPKSDLDTIYIISTETGNIEKEGSYLDFLDSEGNSFQSSEDVRSYIRTLAFKAGGGGGEGATNIVLTQAEYDALTPDPNTTYDIIE